MRGAIVVVIFLVSSLCYAGRESHGGQGVMDRDSIFTLDLYEFGFQNRLSVPRSLLIMTEPYIEEIASEMYLPRQRFYEKIYELYGISPRFADEIMDVFKSMDWQFVKTPLEKTNDDYTDTDRKVPAERIVQLAVRVGGEVKIDLTNYLELTADHRMVLLFHEAVSYYYFEALKDCPFRESTSKNLRRIIALLFISRSQLEDIELNNAIARVVTRDCRNSIKPEPGT